MKKTFTLLSWNVQNSFRVPAALRWDSVWHMIAGYTPFERIVPYLLYTAPDIITLQEIRDAAEKLATVPELSSYHIFIPKNNSKKDHAKPESNSNIVLSKFPIVNAKEISFPESPKNAENCTCIDIQVEKQLLRLYICHFPIFGVGIVTRLTLLERIISDASSHSGPVVICGDLNTTIPKSGIQRIIVRLWHQIFRNEMLAFGEFIKKDEREVLNDYLKKYGFTDVLELNTPTWSPWKASSFELFNLKLDWLITKGLHIRKTTLGEYVSDHKSIYIECEISTE